MEQLLSFDSLSKQVERQQRKAQFRTLILSIAAIAIVGLFLLFTFQQVEHAQQQLKAVNSQIAEANASREQAQASLKTTQEELHAAETRAATLLQQVRSLEAQLAESQKALTSSQQELAESKRQLDEAKQQLYEAKQHLATALYLERYIYELKWEDFKSMYTEYRSGARVLEVIRQLKDRVHWDPTNNSLQGAYNSPGFATLVLQQLNRLPSTGLAGLPLDMGTPNVGDIVVYEGGYRLFYFRDRRNNEFVVGMTPFGVTALDYDFASKIGVLRTGLAR